MNSSLTQKLAIVLALSVIVGVSYVAYTRLLPRFEEQFISLAILGDEQTLEHYYPFDDPTIGVNIPITWFKENITLEEINRRFTRFLQGKGMRRLAPGQVIEGRFYEEELFVFFDKRH